MRTTSTRPSLVGIEFRVPGQGRAVSHDPASESPDPLPYSLFLSVSRDICCPHAPPPSDTSLSGVGKFAGFRPGPSRNASKVPVYTGAQNTHAAQQILLTRHSLFLRTAKSTAILDYGT